MIAMLVKEVRENLRWAAVIALLLSALLAWATNIDLAGGLSLVGPTTGSVSLIAFPAAGLALGLLAVLPDAPRGRWQFVTHRPIGRGRIFAAKVAAGAGLYGVATLVPLLAAYAWAAAPGHVPGPVTPDLLLPRLADWAGGYLWFAAGLLVAARQARWVGSRLMPLGTALIVTGIAVLTSMTFAEYVLIAGGGTALLGLVAAGAFVAGGELPRRAWAVRAAVGLSLGVGCVVAVIAAMGTVAAAVETLVPVPGAQGGRHYQLLDDGRIVTARPDGGGLADLQGKPLTFNDDPLDRHLLASATLGLGSSRPQDMGLIERQSTWGFHTASGHLRPFAYGRVENTAWFFVVAHNAIEGFDTLTRRPVGSLGPAGWSAGPKPFPERLYRVETNLHSAAIPNGAIVAGERTVWQVDFVRREVRRTFTADPGDVVLNAGWFFDTRLNNPGASGNNVVVTRRAVYVFEDGQRPVRVAGPRAGDFMLEVGRALDGRLVLDYVRFPVGPAVPSQSVRVIGTDGRTAQQVELPPLPEPVTRGRVWDEWIQVLPVPPGLLVGLLLGRDFDHDGRRRATLWAVALAVGALAVAVTIPLARRRQHAAAGVAGWAALNLLLGIPGVLLLLSMDDAVPTVPCHACGQPRPVSRQHCPHCGATFAPPAQVGIEVFEAA